MPLSILLLILFRRSQHGWWYPDAMGAMKVTVPEVSVEVVLKPEKMIRQDDWEVGRLGKSLSV
jgi:hypothetical protein